MGWSIKAESIDRIPTNQDLSLGKSAKTFMSAALYTDVRGSSHYGLVHQRRTVAKIFNAFLNGAVRIVKANGGYIRSFNGDSILVFFDPTLDNPCDNAVRSALNLVHFQDKILQPAITKRKFEDHFEIGIGISYGDILATKVGIVGKANSDIIWASNHTNLAAKLGDNGKEPYHIYISSETYERLSNAGRTLEVPGTTFWGKPKRNTIQIWKRYDGFRFAGKAKTVYRTEHASSDLL